jgi:hypothetical protein
MLTAGRWLKFEEVRMLRALEFSISCLAICSIACANPPAATLVEVKPIWDRAPHSAFTDLIYWKDRFICAFREGRSHVSTDGRIRILSSADGKTWTPTAELNLEGFDLRDAGLCVAPGGKLMLVGGAAPRKNDNESAPTGTFVAFSEDGVTWSAPTIVVPPGRWMWRVTWTLASSAESAAPGGDTAYGVSYAAPDGRPFTALLTSEDGVHYRELVSQMCGDGYPTEATLRFGPDGTLFCLQRRDGGESENSALLGTSKAPYTEWKWHDLKIYFGGPNFIQVPSGQWIAAGRTLTDGPKTELALLDVEQKSLHPILRLPSGGDTSYPGLVWHDDFLWVSYYSSHEGKAKIYLAKVRLE